MPMSLHLHHIIIVEFTALARIVIHPIEYYMCVIVGLKPFATDLKTLFIVRGWLSTEPMPLVFMQEYL